MIPRFQGDPPIDLTKPLEEVKIRVDRPLDGERLDVALCKFLTWRSRNSIHQLIRDGFVALPDRRARPASRVRKGDIIRITIPPRAEPDPQIAPDDDNIHILHEDRWMIAVDKPAGLAVHPAGKRLYRTLIHWLHVRYRRPDEPKHDVVPRLMHRIDRETSGVLAASLNEDFHSVVARQFEDREVQKTYLAVVHGHPAEEAGTIGMSIGPDKRSSIRLKLAAYTDGTGQKAVTNYRVVRSNRRFSLVELEPKTGRTHQLRVHMNAIGCPLVGDKIYGKTDEVFLVDLDGQLSEETQALLILGRHALHNHRLRFTHPHDGEQELVAPLPADMADLIDEA